MLIYFPARENLEKWCTCGRRPFIFGSELISLPFCLEWGKFHIDVICLFLQKIVKEKNTLAERLKNAEAARKRFDEELKRFATENVTREEIRQSLEDEVRRLTQTVGQTQGEKREKEEQVARCEAYIDDMQSKLQAYQVSLDI